MNIFPYDLDAEEPARCRFGLPGCIVEHDSVTALAGVLCERPHYFETAQRVVEVTAARWLDAAGAVGMVIVGAAGHDGDELTPAAARRYAAAVLLAADLAEAVR